jgi:hypothetical protein
LTVSNYNKKPKFPHHSNEVNYCLPTGFKSFTHTKSYVAILLIVIAQVPVDSSLNENDLMVYKWVFGGGFGIIPSRLQNSNFRNAQLPQVKAFADLLVVTLWRATWY